MEIPVAPTDRIDDYADLRNARSGMRWFAERFLADEMSVIVAARTVSRLRLVTKDARIRDVETRHRPILRESCREMLIED